MLVRFSIENFLSFCERTSFSMIKSSGNNSLHKEHIVPASNSNDVNLLRSGIIYGANASGKTNLIQSIAFAKKFIVNGTLPGRPILVQPFSLDKNLTNKPSRFEFEIKIQNEIYAYGFIVDVYSVKEEWLYCVGKRKEKQIYDRITTDKKSVIVTYKNLKFKDSSEKSFIQQFSDSIPPNQLLLTELCKRNIESLHKLNSIYNWFENQLAILFPDSKAKGIEFRIEKDKELTKTFSDLLSYFDTGIDGIDLKELNFEDELNDIPNELKVKISEEMKIGQKAIYESNTKNRYALYRDSEKIVAYKLMTKHTLSDINEKKKTTNTINFEIYQESEGTQRLIDIIPALVMLQQEDKVILIDELDRSLHPIITHSIVDLFFGKENKSKNSQLIFTTHESSLLSLQIFRKDEIWFVEKNQYGSSHLYSLQDFKPRYDKDIRKGYILGRFGAIPFIQNTKSLGWTKVK